MKINDQELLLNELGNFRHKFEGRVQFAEVDSFGVVHNIKYLYWLEWARTLYFNSLGVALDSNTFTKNYPLMTVHSEIDYYNPCQFGDKYIVHSKVSSLGNTSLKFENIITGNKKELIVTSSSVLVHVDRNTGASISLPEDIRELIMTFEKY